MRLLFDEKLESIIKNAKEGTRGYIYVAPAYSNGIVEITLAVAPIMVADDIYSNITEKDEEILDYAKDKGYRIMLFHNAYTPRNFLRMHELNHLNPSFNDFFMGKDVDYYKLQDDTDLAFWENSFYEKKSDMKIPSYYQGHIADIKAFHDKILS